jgi:HK97 family phage major capsid protein
MKAQVKVRQLPVDRMNFILDRLQTIAEMDSPSAQQKRESEILMAEQATLRSVLTKDELRAATIERLERMAGVSISASMQLPVRADREWRQFAKNTHERRYVMGKKNEVRAVQEAGQQTISYTTGGAGGYFVPWQYVDRQLAARKAYDGIFADSLEIQTETGKPLQLPSFDDVNQQSAQVNENTNPYPGGLNGQAPTINAAVTQLGAFTFRSGVVYVSLEALEDSGSPWTSLLERAFSVRHARGVGQALIVGAGGGNAPTGILTALNALDLPEVIAGGANPNTGNASDTGANSIGSQDLTDLYFSINMAYWQNACWYMNQSTLQTIVEKVDKIGNPIVRYTESDYGFEPYIFGKKVSICPSMPVINPNAPVIVFGALREFFAYRHCAAGEYVQRLDETHAEIGLVGFQGFTRVDSNLVVPNASYPPANQLVMHS